jgi:hypothetical protein
MRYINERRPRLVPDLAEEFQDSRLGRYVETGRGFIEHQHSWTTGKRDGNSNPLLLSPGELERIPAMK